MSDLFGSPIGTRLLESDYADVVQSGLGSLHRLGQIANQPLEQENLKATTRLHTAQAEKAEAEVEKDRALAELSRKAFAGGGAAGPARPVSMADQLDNLATLAAEAGMVDQAQRTAASAALIRSREAAGKAAQVTQALNQQKMLKEATGVMAQYFGAATDAESWQRANELYAFQTGRQSPYASVPFSENLVDQINQSALTSKERYDLMEKELTREGLREYRDKRLKQHDVLATISRSRLELARQRETRLAKAGGGKQVGVPSSTETRLAKTFIDKDYPADNFNIEGREEAAITIASDARALRRQNPALDPAAAMRLAYENAKRSGDFQVTANKWAKSDAKFERRGRDPQTPLAMPKAASEAVPGRFYSTPKGTLLWNGDKFLSGAEAARWLSTNNGRDESSTEDDDEGDDE